MLTLAQNSPFAAIMNPPVLFFFLGALAAIVKSNLRVPPAVTKLLSLYLLWAIGFRGGVEISHSTFGREAILSLGLAMVLALLVPLYTFHILRRKFDVSNSAALAATYGSISAVTFMTATNLLESKGIAFGGHMVAAMALMESPAIVIGVILLRIYDKPELAPVADGATAPKAKAPGWGTLMHEAFLNGPVVLLMGSLIIGLITSDTGYRVFKPLCTDLFSGVLVFFLLDLGLVAARRLKSVRQAGVFGLLFATVIPVFNSAIAIAAAYALKLEEGNAILLAVLAGSASYIAVPAAVRIAIPKAQPGLYLPMSLAVTFPFSIGIGLPVNIAVVEWLWK